jgi:glycosyltransferase involved in cell wall biosynthesis
MKNDKPRVIFFQPALPSYREDFFNRTAELLDGNFEMYYSNADMGALTDARQPYPWARCLGEMRQLPLLSFWQSGAMSVPFSQQDIIIVSGAPRCLTNILLLIKARLKGSPVVWFGHFWSSTTARHRFFVRIMLMKLANAVLFYTDQEIEEYRTGIGKKDRRIITAINNGIDNEDIIVLRAPYDANKRKKSILFIGRIFEKCELEILIEAMTYPIMNDIELNIIGDGPSAPLMKAFAERSGLSERIVWHGGTTDERKIAAIANRCRLFAFPGAVGLSLIHAMGYGLPSVINDSRWTNGPEITAFTNDETGREFRKGDAQSMAVTIAGAISDETALNRWSIEAKRRVDDIFNTKLMAQRLLELIERIRMVHAVTD